MANRFLIYGITAEEWTKRYGIEPFSCPCSGCGEMLTTTIPFIRGTIRGLTAPTCKCGIHRLSQMKVTSDTIVCWPPYVIIRDPKYGDLFDGDLSK